jgi:hypothetical protein
MLYDLVSLLCTVLLLTGTWSSSSRLRIPLQAERSLMLWPQSLAGLPFSKCKRCALAGLQRGYQIDCSMSTEPRLLLQYEYFCVGAPGSADTD